MCLLPASRNNVVSLVTSLLWRSECVAQWPPGPNKFTLWCRTWRETSVSLVWNAVTLLQIARLLFLELSATWPTLFLVVFLARSLSGSVMVHGKVDHWHVRWTWQSVSFQRSSFVVGEKHASHWIEQCVYSSRSCILWQWPCRRACILEVGGLDVLAPFYAHILCFHKPA